MKIRVRNKMRRRGFVQRYRLISWCRKAMRKIKLNSDYGKFATRMISINVTGANHIMRFPILPDFTIELQSNDAMVADLEMFTKHINTTVANALGLPKDMLSSGPSLLDDPVSAGNWVHDVLTKKLEEPK